LAYDEKLAERVRALLSAHPAVTERKMFGGIAFMVGGSMCCGVVGDDLMVRTGPDKYAEALSRPHARPMDFTGRPMKGMLYVGALGCRSDSDLEQWVRTGAEFAASLPSKKGTKERG